jgi:hypothetical protein
MISFISLSLIVQSLLASFTGNSKKFSDIIQQIESYLNNDSLNYRMDGISQMLYFPLRAILFLSVCFLIYLFPNLFYLIY